MVLSQRRGQIVLIVLLVLIVALVPVGIIVWRFVGILTSKLSASGSAVAFSKQSQMYA